MKIYVAKQYLEIFILLEFVFLQWCSFLTCKFLIRILKITEFWHVFHYIVNIFYVSDYILIRQLFSTGVPLYQILFALTVILYLGNFWDDYFLFLLEWKYTEVLLLYLSLFFCDHTHNNQVILQTGNTFYSTRWWCGSKKKQQQANTHIC